MLKVTFLILSFFLFSSCNKVFPVKFVWIPDIVHMTCNKWAVPATKDGKFVFVSTGPASDCDGIFGIQPEDVGPLKNWASDSCK